jgi:hypothetical protein
VEDGRSRCPIAFKKSQHIILSSSAVYRENATSCAVARLENVLEDGDLIVPEWLALGYAVEPDPT